MTQENKLDDLKSAWKKIEASENAAKKALTESTEVSKKFSVADTNSKPVKPVTRDEGATSAHTEDKDTHGTKKAVNDLTKPVKRDEGSVAGHKEVGDDHGTKKGVGTDESVSRKEGSGAAVQKYSEFRNKIKSVLGLALTDPLNATGKGLNK